MKLLSGISLFFLSIAFTSTAFGQIKCASADYAEHLKRLHPATTFNLLKAEQFINQQKDIKAFGVGSKGDNFNIIHIPVVVHIIYKSASQNISDEQVKSQIEALNRDYRRQNADTVNTPARFRSVAADIQMDFALATADINGRATSGIIRKHTNTDWWLMDDEIKSSGSGGDDAWDSRYYLNIWVGNLQAVLGYASVPGGPVEKDGVVISTNAFGTINSSAPYNLGRTGVHETGHWMGLKHPWGDTYCGDDKVDDTPKQGSFTTGCPGGVFRSSCDNGALGDMYMNYMDFTDDACMNLFTAGQKQRMLSLFNPGGPRNLLLSSKGLQSPWVFTSLPKTDDTPHLSSSVHIYPNPASNEINLNLDDNTWIGKDINLLNLNGTLIISLKITSTTQKINVDHLKPGMYFIEANSNNGKIRQRFLKL